MRVQSLSLASKCAQASRPSTVASAPSLTQAGSPITRLRAVQCAFVMQAMATQRSSASASDFAPAQG